MTERIRVEVAYVDARHQFLRACELAVGSTVAEAITASGLAEATGIDVDAHDAGVWSKHVARDHVLSDGDRVEVYRPLLIDPKEARRARAIRR
ncbi:RnfH family protein [Dokdonella sp.]|uniref:RnfH family protein n=1 Tax=Dokdonella sp. TaxID=2291710 RepID=UPI0025C6B50E|nr:RnfH family protein [Dokdonella sp.]MBX3693419.1 RnfH family protein [Dokdonella sp.]